MAPDATTRKRPRTPSSSDLLTLFCFIVGSNEDEVFPVHVSSSATVHDLKKEIEQEARLNEIASHKLHLFKISIPDEDDLAQKVEDAVKAGKPLRSTMEISDLFPRPPPKRTIQIAVKLPDDVVSGKSNPEILDFQGAGLLVNRWRSKFIETRLPTVAELTAFVDRPLSEEEKIPIRPARMQELVSNAAQDLCTIDDVKLLFRSSDRETPLDQIFTAVNASPPVEGNENAFILCWDQNVRSILELLLPDGRSNRNSSQHTATKMLRPDYVLLIDDLCPFRGEEKGPGNQKDPKMELRDKLEWAYSPAPYVLGYYAQAARLTMAAISAPSGPSGRPVVHDVAHANLRLRKDRIKNICCLINLAGLVQAIAGMVRPSGVEYKTLQRDNSTVEIVGRYVIKCYTGSDRALRVAHLRNIYALLKEIDVPHVDSLFHSEDSIAILSPRGIPDEPKTERELLEALICVLEALEVLHGAAKPVFHRDIRWPNVIRRLDDESKWFIIDWEDAATPPTKAQPRFNSSTHSSRIFVDGHGAEVDIWGVGGLILHCSALDISSELRDLGKWMQSSTAPSAQEALGKIKDYQSQRVNKE